MNHLVTAVWVLLMAGVVVLLSIPSGREAFEAATRAQPYLLGIAKIGLLGTMGELLGARIATGRWRLTGIRLWQRMLVWGFLGIVFTAVFPIFSFGVDGLLDKGLLPGKGLGLLTAFWKSFFMNTVFAFPMMVFHRTTDMLIDRGKLFTSWPVADIFQQIDWKNMFRVVGAACIWFWIPAHTFTFVLPAEYRVMSAALLAIVLGVILGIAKKRAAASTAPAVVASSEAAS